MTRKMLVVYRGHINNHILHPEHGIGAWKLSQLTARSVGDFETVFGRRVLRCRPPGKSWRRCTAFLSTQSLRIGLPPMQRMG